MHEKVFWDVKFSQLVLRYRRFGGGCSLRLQSSMLHVATKNMDTASSSNQNSAITQKTLVFAKNTVTISEHSGGAAGCGTASQGKQFLKLQKNMSSAFEDEPDIIPSQRQERLDL